MRHQGGFIQRLLRTVNGHGGWLRIVARRGISRASLAGSCRGRCGGRSRRVSRYPRYRKPQHRLGHRAAAPPPGRFRVGRADLCLAVRNRRLEKRREAVRQTRQRIHQASDVFLCDHCPVRRDSPVPPDRVLSQVDELPDGHFLSVLCVLLHPLSARDRDTLPVLVWLGCDAGRQQKNLSHVSSAFCSTCSPSSS